VFYKKVCAYEEQHDTTSLPNINNRISEINTNMSSIEFQVTFACVRMCNPHLWSFVEIRGRISLVLSLIGALTHGMLDNINAWLILTNIYLNILTKFLYM
jgi:hypothetical protein